MNREAIEELSKRIVEEGSGVVSVLGIEHMGPSKDAWLATDFFVKCVHKASGLVFAVKSPGHWEYFKRFYICAPTVALIENVPDDYGEEKP